MNKVQLRKQMKALRDGIEDRAEKSRRICENAACMEEYACAACVMLYMPIRSEVDLRPLAEKALREGKRVCLPVTRENGEMDAVEYTGKECLKTGAFGVPEPQGAVVEPELIDLILCPGLAFDALGGRLGYGKGYYDRYSEKVRAFLAGICYTECIVEKVPAEMHDQRMQAVVTQDGIRYMGGKKNEGYV